MSYALSENAVLAILLATVCYQAILCFMNTHGLSTSRTLVGFAEALIYFSCIPLLMKRLLPNVIIITLVGTATLFFLTLISGSINAKAFRDLLIPLCYFWLGCNMGRPELVEKLLLWLITLVLAFGILETLFLDTYTSLFDIFSYYVSTGNLEPITDYVRESRLQLNGIRPEGIGRTLLPELLGSHRVSSLFLEPVSLGNFAAICAAWGLSRDIHELRKLLFFVGVAIVLMVLSDSRFALMSVSLMIAMRLVLHGRALTLAIVAPFACTFLLLILGLYTTDNLGDNFRGRLAISGWSLLEFDVPTLMGATPSKNFGDQGYAYALSNFGLPMCLLLWFSFWLLPIQTQQGERFRAYVGIYIALILCVSGSSLFALKTAGIVWFLMGSCLYARQSK
jgi:putative polymerase